MLDRTFADIWLFSNCEIDIEMNQKETIKHAASFIHKEMRNAKNALSCDNISSNDAKSMAYIVETLTNQLIRL